MSIRLAVLTKCVPNVSQEAVGVGHGASLVQVHLDILLQLPGEVLQVQVPVDQIPGEATLQPLQPEVKILVCRAAAQRSGLTELTEGQRTSCGNTEDRKVKFGHVSSLTL